MDAGVSWEQVAEQVANQQNVPPQVQSYMERLEAKIASLEQANEQSSKAMTEQQQRAYQDAVKQIKMDASNLVAKNTSYETIKATNSINDVVELIERTFKEDGYVMSVEEACDAVEEHLTEEIERLSNLEKFKKRRQPQATAKEPSPQTQAQELKQTQPMKTLTNTMGASRPLSARERAVLAFQGKLK